MPSTVSFFVKNMLVFFCVFVGRQAECLVVYQAPVVKLNGFEVLFAGWVFAKLSA